MESVMYEYKAKIVKVIDGDTVKLDIDLGFHLHHKNQNFRIMGIDTPEVRGEEKDKGKICKEFVKTLLPKGEEFIIVTSKPDKYGRWLADIRIFVAADNELVKQTWLSEYLIDKGYAKRYTGKGSVSFPLREAYPLIEEN
jgi:micrococcal nuclease